MFRWLFPAQHKRQACVEQRIASMLEEAQGGATDPPRLAMAALRLQGLARDDGVLLSFGQAVEHLLKRDKKELFAR